MKRIACIVAVLGISLFALSALAGVTLSNQDSQSYKLLIASSDSCFSGTHTSISSNTTTGVGPGWLCIDEKKPGYEMKDGETWIIKNGKPSKK
ncbi:MAG TPA: hypothetical protein PK668_03670 [Myxococcota bacterium]|nr:hypothetical protein [Myxococcota bacterium]HRY91955.1 hypothetical protein [Myxococcota bacterium]HSA20674.1 hypothetical protein [Myxococcota bacterium]